jgi:hypothetical protein
MVGGHSGSVDAGACDARNRKWGEHRTEGIGVGGQSGSVDTRGLRCEKPQMGRASHGGDWGGWPMICRSGLTNAASSFKKYRMITTLFIGFVVLMAVVVVSLSARYLNGRTAFAITAGLFTWLIYVGLLGYFGVVRNAAMRPPGITLIFVPVLAFLVLSILGLQSSAGARLAMAFPLWIILSTQSFRIVVELFLHQLWIDGLCPKMLTFAGANVDIYVGASAPLIAWLSTRGRSGLRLVLIWNVVGLLSLINVVIRAVLTAPGPFNLIHAEVPNLMIGTFPFMFIPGFFVPLAVVLHVLAVRAIVSRTIP